MYTYIFFFFNRLTISIFFRENFSISNFNYFFIPKNCNVCYFRDLEVIVCTTYDDKPTLSIVTN